MTILNLSSSLHQHFGFDSFRAGQEEAIQSLLNKQHTLAIMPTGAGKWTRNIPPPSTPKRYDPNGLSFNSSEVLGNIEWDDDFDEG